MTWGKGKMERRILCLKLQKNRDGKDTLVGVHRYDPVPAEQEVQFSASMDGATAAST